MPKELMEGIYNLENQSNTQWKKFLYIKYTLFLYLTKNTSSTILIN